MGDCTRPRKDLELLESPGGGRREPTGREVIQGGRVGDHGEFCYFELAETGSILELLFLEERPPSETIIS